jgi:hypothetical protein
MSTRSRSSVVGPLWPHRTGPHTAGLPRTVTEFHRCLRHRFVVAAGALHLYTLTQLVGDAGAGTTLRVSWQAAPMLGVRVRSGVALPTMTQWVNLHGRRVADHVGAG